MHNDMSVILIKPDGCRSPSMRELLSQCLKSKSLRVTRRQMLHLGRDEVLGIWPVFGGPEHPVTRELYCRYMGSGPSEALVIDGRDSLASCVQIKKRIRQRF